jgi:SHS2 domain-containing protein
MFRAMYGECNGNTVTEEFTLEAGDMEELLHDFLSELLFLSDIHEAVFCFFQVEIEGTSLSATIRGVPFNREKHQGTEIKGVSYYGLEIVKGEDSYATDILFDM